MQEEECQKCHGTGKVRDRNGQIHTCWDCLQKGKLDVHSKRVPDSDIRI